MSGNALRIPGRQYLSAAFNLNTEFIDDLDDAPEDGRRISLNFKAEDWKTMSPEEKEKIRNIRLRIARRAIQVVLQGGFDKVTVDGAADFYPSTVLLDQLGLRQSLEWVHEAHSVGLTTYMSAGFKFDDVPPAVYTGVDGIGIGGAQILRYMDHATGSHGPYVSACFDDFRGCVFTQDPFRPRKTWTRS